MGLDMKTAQENGGLTHSEIMRARDRDAARLRRRWEIARIIREDAEISALQEAQRRQDIEGHNRT